MLRTPAPLIGTLGFMNSSAAINVGLAVSPALISLSRLAGYDNPSTIRLGYLFLVFPILAATLNWKCINRTAQQLPGTLPTLLKASLLLAPLIGYVAWG